MAFSTIDSKALSRMFLAGAKSLESKKEWINELNVFPVPDGDTGTNMTMTIMSAAREVSALSDDADMKTVCKAISSGSLRGARGNSGVILSQLLRGFTKVASEHESLDIPLLVEAIDRAVETAYKAVMKPKEGTILTVAKGISQKADALCDEGEEDLDVFISECIKYGEEVLSKTPDMLPVLKQAGVVDSGGQGLIEVLHGVYDAFLGKEIDFTITEVKPVTDHDNMNLGVNNASYRAQAEAEIKFGYCTEFIILLSKPFNIKNEIDFKEFLESIGDSIVLVADDEVVKVHVHTNDPGIAIQKALLYGQLSNMKIDNMRIEHQEKLFKMDEQKKAEAKAEDASAKEISEEDFDGEEKEMAFVSVCAGSGLAEIFKSIGVDYVISGGQTMNPSTEDILKAVERVNAKTIFVLPNNKNIIMAATQASELVEDKKVIVIPTKTVPQGITAVLSFDESATPEENEEAMKDAVSGVLTCEVTYAVRDTIIDDQKIHKNDFMGIGDKGLLAVTRDLDKTVMKSLEEMMDDDKELISLYYGEDVSESEAEAVSSKISEEYPNVDVEVQYGGQPVYYYIISVE